MALDPLDINFLLLDELVDEAAFADGAGDDGVLLWYIDILDGGGNTRDLAHVITQVVGGTDDALPIILVNDDGGSLAVFGNTKLIIS